MQNYGLFNCYETGTCLEGYSILALLNFEKNYLLTLIFLLVFLPMLLQKKLLLTRYKVTLKEPHTYYKRQKQTKYQGEKKIIQFSPFFSYNLFTENHKIAKEIALAPISANGNAYQIPFNW